MRIKLVFLLTVSLSSTAFGQYNSEGELNISRFRPGSMWFFTGFRPAIPEKVRKYDRLIFDLTYNDWLGDLDPFKNNWRSLGLNSNLMFDIPITKGNTVSFGTGLTHSIFRISSRGHLFGQDSTNTYTVHTLEGNTFAPSPRTHLCGNSLSVPLEFRFRTKGWKHFKFHIGGRVGYQFNIYSKAVSEGLNGKLVTRNYDFPDVNRFVYSAHVRIGIRNWSLFASYGLNSLFSNKSSVQLNILQFGLSVSLF